MPQTLLAIAALMVQDRHVAENVSFDVNPTSRELLEQLGMGRKGAAARATAATRPDPDR